MTVAELREILAHLDPELLVVIAGDKHAPWAMPLETVGPATYCPLTSWYGSLEAQHRPDFPPQHAVVLWPAN